MPQGWQPSLLLRPTVLDQVPGGHSLKTEAELAPTSSQKPPAAQGWQAVLPLVGEKVPAGHGLHWREPVSAWNDPLRTKHECSIESYSNGKGPSACSRSQRAPLAFAAAACGLAACVGVVVANGAVVGRGQRGHVAHGAGGAFLTADLAASPLLQRGGWTAATPRAQWARERAAGEVAIGNEDVGSGWTGIPPGSAVAVVNVGATRVDELIVPCCAGVGRKRAVEEAATR